MQKPRMEYLDALRGFAILLVVMTHLYTFVWVGNDNELDKILAHVRMPLFFFISGYFACIAPPDGKMLIWYWGRGLLIG